MTIRAVITDTKMIIEEEEGINDDDKYYLKPADMLAFFVYHISPIRKNTNLTPFQPSCYAKPVGLCREYLVFQFIAFEKDGFSLSRCNLFIVTFLVN